MRKDNLELFEKASIPKAVLSNALPSVVSMITVLLHNLASTFFLGQTGNAYMVAAVSIAMPVFMLTMAMGSLFGIGGTSVISRALGEGRKEYAKKVSSFCFWTGTGGGILYMIVIWVFEDWFCTIIGASPDTVGYARDYMRIMALTVPLAVIGNTFSNIIRAEGRPMMAMTGALILNIINIALDPILILVLGWGVKGAALAVFIAHIFGNGCYIMYLLGKKTILSIHPKDYCVKDKVLTNVFAIGIPASLTGLLMTLANLTTNNLIAKFSDLAIAGYSVSTRVAMITGMTLMGIGQGVQPLFGFCVGARLRERYKEIFRFSVRLVLGVSIVMSAACFIGMRALISAFIDTPEVIEYGARFGRVVTLAGPGLGLLTLFTGAIQAMGAARPALILSVSRQGFVYIPLAFLFNYVFHTIEALAAAQVAADFLSATLAFILHYHWNRRLMRDFAAQEIPQEIQPLAETR
jgi:putative MATE family efflux protein